MLVRGVRYPNLVTVGFWRMGYLAPLKACGVVSSNLKAEFIPGLVKSLLLAGSGLGSGRKNCSLMCPGKQTVGLGCTLCSCQFCSALEECGSQSSNEQRLQD